MGEDDVIHHERRRHRPGSLTRSGEYVGYPDWSPNGSKLAYILERQGNRDIYTMRRDGSNMRRLTNDPAYDNMPSWSPDGDWIVFSSNRDGDEDIYVMYTNGREIRNLTNNSGIRDLAPEWSPTVHVPDFC